MTKPFAESCAENREPILQVLKRELADKKHLLEIGSGTGQHAVYFGEEFPEMIWQTSDRIENHPGIHAWVQEYSGDNLKTPIELDVSTSQWPDNSFDAVFSANTAHIMSWEQVTCMFSGVGNVLESNGVFCLYGPFNYNGAYTAPSNERFDAWLKERDPLSGIRHFEELVKLAEQNNIKLKEDYEMPANNRTLVWIKE